MGKRTLMLLLGCLVAGGAAAGDPWARLADVDDGVVRLDYPVRDRVNDEEHRVVIGGRSRVIEGPTAERRALVELELRDGRVCRLDLRLGARWREDDADLDLGPVDPAEAAAWFLELARQARPEVAEDAVHAAAVARDADVAGPLAALARDRGLDEEVRETALMLLAVYAAEEAVEPLTGLTRDQRESAEVREAAVVALSLLPEERALPLLLDMARNHEHPEVRSTALVLLGQHGGEEVIALLESILLDDGARR